MKSVYNTVEPKSFKPRNKYDCWNHVKKCWLGYASWMSLDWSWRYAHRSLQVSGSKQVAAVWQYGVHLPLHSSGLVGWTCCGDLVLSHRALNWVWLKKVKRDNNIFFVIFWIDLARREASKRDQEKVWGSDNRRGKGQAEMVRVGTLEHQTGSEWAPEATAQKLPSCSPALCLCCFFPCV